MLRLITLCICGTMLVAVAAVAGGIGPDALFDKLDRNKDGVISREEFTSCPLVRTEDGHIQHRDLCARPGVSLSVEEKGRLYDKITLDSNHAITRKRLYRFATPDGFAPVKF